MLWQEILCHIFVFTSQLWVWNPVMRNSSLPHCLSVPFRCERGVPWREIHHHLCSDLLSLLLQDEGRLRARQTYWQGKKSVITCSVPTQLPVTMSQSGHEKETYWQGDESVISCVVAGYLTVIFQSEGPECVGWRCWSVRWSCQQDEGVSQQGEMLLQGGEGWSLAVSVSSQWCMKSCFFFYISLFYGGSTLVFQLVSCLWTVFIPLTPGQPHFILEGCPSVCTESWLGEKSLAAPGSQTCVSSLSGWMLNQLSYISTPEFVSDKAVWFCVES